MFTFGKMAFRNLVQARRRTALLGLAIAFVAFVFVMLRSAADSVSTQMIRAATTLSSGHVNVAGFHKARRKGASPMVTNRTELKEYVRKVVPESTEIIDRHRGWGRIVSPSSSINTGLNGIEFDQEQRLFASLRLAPESEYLENGRNEVLGSFENLKKPNNALLFSSQAKKLNVTVGDSLTLVMEAASEQTNTVDLVVGVVVSDVGFLSNWSIFVPRQTILDVYRIGPETTGSIMIYLKDENKSNAVMERMRKALTDKQWQVMDHDPRPFFMKFDKVFGEDWLGQRYDVTTWSDEISFIVWITTAFTLVTTFITGIMSVIIAGGIGNTMWMAVRERIKEIGTMRAIGTQRGQIRRLFIAEAMFLGCLASAVGTLLAWSVIGIVNASGIPITNEGARVFLMANTLHFSFVPTHLMSTVVLFGLITAFGALAPSHRAAKLKPVEALMQSK